MIELKMTSCNVEITVGSGRALPAYLARSEEQYSRGSIVLLQEIFGVNANMQEIADGYAVRGFDAVVPDLFWHQQPGVQLDPGSAADRDRATELMKGMDQSLALEDAQAAARYVRRLDNASSKVAAVGYCLGGKLAYLLATRRAVDAAVSYYGVGIQSALDQAGAIGCPMLVHMAEADHLCPPQAQAAIKEALGLLPSITIISYPGVGHAFARRGGTSFDAAAAQRADQATSAFLASALQTAA